MAAPGARDACWHLYLLLGVAIHIYKLLSLYLLFEKHLIFIYDIKKEGSDLIPW